MLYKFAIQSLQQVSIINLLFTPYTYVNSKIEICCECITFLITLASNMQLYNNITSISVRSMLFTWVGTVRGMDDQMKHY